MHHGACQRVCVSDTRTLRTRDKCSRRHQSIDHDTCVPRVLRSFMCMMLPNPYGGVWHSFHSVTSLVLEVLTNFHSSASPGGICFATEDRPFGMVHGWPRKCIGGSKWNLKLG